MPLLGALFEGGGERPRGEGDLRGEAECRSLPGDLRGERLSLLGDRRVVLIRGDRERRGEALPGRTCRLGFVPRLLQKRTPKKKNE